jgi:methionyl-tRNA formyltransferase
LGIETIQPARMRDPEALARLHAWQPDLIVVTAFGQILRQNVLDLPPYGCINVHASLLPRWRGASPIQAAILHGDATSGVTIMKMDAGIDTGPILAQETVAIDLQDTAATLAARLAEAGAQLLIETLPAYIEGKITPKPQPEEGATYASMLQKQEGQLDFSQPAEVLARRVRAFNPWPGAFLSWPGGILKVHQAYVVHGDSQPVGQAGRIHNLPAIHTTDGWLVLDIVQPAGKKPMAGDVFLRGTHQWEGILPWQSIPER